MKNLFIGVVWLFITLPVILHAQSADLTINTVITGSVADAKTYIPLEGATVRIKGITNQALTDKKGNFTLKTAQKLPLILEVQFVGYKTQEIEAAYNNINIQLQDEQTQLNEGSGSRLWYATQERYYRLSSQRK